MATSSRPTPHAIEQVHARYNGLTISFAVLRRWERAIADGRCLVICKQPTGRKVCDIDHDGQTIRVVYDPAARRIVTALTREMFVQPGHQDTNETRRKKRA